MGQRVITIYDEIPTKPGGGLPLAIIGTVPFERRRVEVADLDRYGLRAKLRGAWRILRSRAIAVDLPGRHESVTLKMIGCGRVGR